MAVTFRPDPVDGQLPLPNEGSPFEPAKQPLSADPADPPGGGATFTPDTPVSYTHLTLPTICSV